MRLFSEKVTPTYTKSAVNILTVEDFNEIFYDVYELTINGKQFVAEKVSEYRGAPVVEVPIIIEGVESQVSFVLSRGKFEVLVSRSNFKGKVPVEESYETPRTIKYLDKGNTVEEVIYDKSEGIQSEIKTAKDQVQKYEDSIKLERKINRYIADCKEELFFELDQKYNDAILTLERSDIELNRFVIETTKEAIDTVDAIETKFEKSLESTVEKIEESIEITESKIKEYYNNKIAVIEERVLDLTEENKQYFVNLISESKRNLLKEIADLKKATPELINEKTFNKQNVDLKGIKSELEKVIGTKFSTEISALRRLIELSSGGGSVAKQFAQGGFMDGNLTVNGLISAHNLTITGTISTTMLEALSANIRYLDINTYELSGFHSTGDVSIDGNLTVTGTISTTMLEATSANITYIDIRQYELSGFDVTGDVKIDGDLTVTGVISGKSYVNDPTGRVIIVDDITGTDSRSGLIKYDQFKPYKTIEAAVSDSTVGDLVYVRAGNYIINNSVYLDGKGKIHFETGTFITTTAPFIISASETKAAITGYADFHVSYNSLILTNQGELSFECNDITSNITNSLFYVTGGILNISFNTIIATSALIFNVIISGHLTARSRGSVTCKQFIASISTGTIDINVDNVTSLSNSLPTINLESTSSFIYKGANITNEGSQPCLSINYSVTGQGPVIKDVRMKTSGIPIICYNNGAFSDVFLDSVKLNSLTTSNPSISSSLSPTTIYSTTTYSNVLPDPSIVVDGQYNLMTKLF
jgi:hypothetical protein